MLNASGAPVEENCIPAVTEDKTLRLALDWPAATEGTIPKLMLLLAVEKGTGAATKLGGIGDELVELSRKQDR